MPRLARVAIPELPYHVTQRGNRRHRTFFENSDRRVYLGWLANYSRKYDLEIWAYCLMSNHVHLLVMGHQGESLARTVGRTHGRYAQWQNRKHQWSGHFWSGRFYSTPLDERHLWAAVKYIELNPVRSGLVEVAEKYPWSSARAHAAGIIDPILSPDSPFPGPVGDWSEWLKTGLDAQALDRIRRNTSTGRPTGSDSFTLQIESHLGRNLHRQKTGRKPKSTLHRR